MAEKKLRRCSGSSLNLRVQMDQNYVIVHDVSSNVSFEKYIQFARGCFDQAVKLYNKKDYQRAYVDFTKFHQFVADKLPSHQNYDKSRTEFAKIWLAQADEACLQFLEEISLQLDTIEDEKMHPNSRSPFLVEMQKHSVDIFVPEWIDPDSDDEETSTRNKNIPVGDVGGRTDRRVQGDIHLRHNTESHQPTFQQQQYTAPSQPLPRSPMRPELPPYSPHQHVMQIESRGYKSHSESQDLALAIQESLLSAQPPPSDAFAHTQQQQQLHSHHPPAYKSATHHKHTLPVGQHHYNGDHGTPHSISPTHHQVHTGLYLHTNAVHPHSHQHSRQHQHQHSHQYAAHSPTSHGPSLPYYAAPGLTQDDAAILQYCKAYTTFDIPPPTVARHSIYIGNHAHHFEQHDFHLSFTPFLRTLPPELHMTRAAVEVNRCFFIHLGVATQLHPYALQSYFRHTAAAEKSIEADWQVELARSISEYAGLIDANVLQYTWPENFDKYRILLISGPAEDPLLTCFVPKIRNRSVEDLYEIVIRNDRSHFTLLRPLANLTTKIKIIDAMLGDAARAHTVYQVCDVTSKPHRSVGAIFEKI